MWEDILRAALESGLWAALFCVLLAYLLRDSRVREQKYRDTIDSLMRGLSVLDEVRGYASETLRLLRGKYKRGSRGSLGSIDTENAEGAECEGANV
ncbi:MAG: hypothetical protein HFE36_00965 [Clostridia bacterium]|nr:hypothetical protein [Clostridia bacterium]